jgi:formiminoglutamase
MYYKKMKNLQFISSETLKRVTKKRTGEKKLHEVVQYLTDSNDFLERIADPKIEFVIFGIKEDIGVLANHGQPGARDTWDSVIKPLLNIQSNEHTNASTILILGHLDFTDLYETYSLTSSEKSLKTYRKHVELIDQNVNQLVCSIVKAGKIPIVIGGGHNNAYGIIKGFALGLKTKVNAVNFDAHTDLRTLEGRHSGNGFSYAIEEGFLDRYFIFGLHENYISKKILKYISGSKSKIKFISFEDLIVRKKTSVKKASKNALKFISKSNFGIEIDCDAIENIPSSAQTPSGFSVNQTRQFIHYFGKHKKASYLHICEAATLKDEQLNEQTGKLISYLITDFIRAKKT